MAVCVRPQVLVALAVAASGCANAPPAAHPPYRGNQSVQVIATDASASFAGSQLAPRLGGGWGTATVPPETVPLTGAHCVASNDRGSWPTASPGRVEVAVSTAPLTIACRREGYRDASIELRCITPRQRSVATGTMAGLRIAQLMGPGAVVALPVAGLVALFAAPPLVGAAAGYAAAGPNPDECVYDGVAELRVEVPMSVR